MNRASQRCWSGSSHWLLWQFTPLPDRWYGRTTGRPMGLWRWPYYAQRTRYVTAAPQRAPTEPGTPVRTSRPPLASHRGWRRLAVSAVLNAHLGQRQHWAALARMSRQGKADIHIPAASSLRIGFDLLPDASPFTLSPGSSSAGEQVWATSETRWLSRRGTKPTAATW